MSVDAEPAPAIRTALGIFGRLFVLNNPGVIVTVNLDAGMALIIIRLSTSGNVGSRLVAILKLAVSLDFRNHRVAPYTGFSLRFGGQFPASASITALALSPVPVHSSIQRQKVIALTSAAV